MTTRALTTAPSRASRAEPPTRPSTTPEAPTRAQNQEQEPQDQRTHTLASRSRGPGRPPAGHFGPVGLLISDLIFTTSCAAMDILLGAERGSRGGPHGFEDQPRLQPGLPVEG